MDKDCVLCCDLLTSRAFNLKTLKSKHTNTPLLSLVKKVVGEFFSLHFYICLQCYNLISELDGIEFRQAEIHKQLRTYIETNKPEAFKQELNNRDEDLSVIEYSAIHDISDNDLFTSNNEESDLNNELSDTLTLKCNTDILESELTSPNREKCKKNNKPLEVVTEANIKIRGRRKKYPDIAKPHRCHCLKEFRTLWELKNHVNHCDYHSYICEICGLGYKNKPAFRRHMDMHNGINPFTCVYCNKSFTQKGSLGRHVRIHTGEKHYQCDECGKRFLHHTSFNIHQLSHTGKKSYKCEVCGLALMSSSHLNRHKRVHTGEKRFMCNTCGRRFAENYNLVTHEKLHSNPKSILSVNAGYSSQIRKKGKAARKRSNSEN